MSQNLVLPDRMTKLARVRHELKEDGKTAVSQQDGWMITTVLVNHMHHPEV